MMRVIFDMCAIIGIITLAVLLIALIWTLIENGIKIKQERKQNNYIIVKNEIIEEIKKEFQNGNSNTK